VSWREHDTSWKFEDTKSYEVTNRGPVVQSPISANPGLNFNLLFLFMYFRMIICFKTLENKTSIEPEKRFLEKHIQLD
jgi:hypothetical protein